MKAALVTPFLGHLPLYPSSHIGFGASVLGNRFELDIIDLNAEIFFEYRRDLKDALSGIDVRPVASDSSHLDPLRGDILANIEEHYQKVPWRDYESVFITMPSWFVNVTTEDILRLSNAINGKSPETRLFFFGNSLGSWTDKNRLSQSNINVVHLNNLFEVNAVNEPVDYDALPTPIYKDRKKYIFDILPFRLKHGCTWGKCRFCSLAKGWNSGYKERSSKAVIHEIARLDDIYSPKMFTCNDNSMNGGNLTEFCSYFERFNKPWAGMARADLSDKEILALRRAECRLVYFGLESGSDSVLCAMKKGINSRQLSDFIKKLCDNSIMPGPSLIVGFPGETEADFDMTLEFILEHKNYLRIVNLYPFALTPYSDFSLEEEPINTNTLFRLLRLTLLCESNGIKVCVGEQTAEYVLYKAAYPSDIIY